MDGVQQLADIEGADDAAVQAEMAELIDVMKTKGHQLYLLKRSTQVRPATRRRLLRNHSLIAVLRRCLPRTVLEALCARQTRQRGEPRR